MATIIKPSWLEVERAMIFFTSLCTVADHAAKVEVRAPRQRQIVRARGLFESRGCRRSSRNTPATTIVLEWSRAETGVGPSMAEISQG